MIPGVSRAGPPCILSCRATPPRRWYWTARIIMQCGAIVSGARAFCLPGLQCALSKQTGSASCDRKIQSLLLPDSALGRAGAFVLPYARQGVVTSSSPRIPLTDRVCEIDPNAHPRDRNYHLITHRSPARTRAPASQRQETWRCREYQVGTAARRGIRGLPTPRVPDPRHPRHWPVDSQRAFARPASSRLRISGEPLHAAPGQHELHGNQDH